MVFSESEKRERHREANRKSYEKDPDKVKRQRQEAVVRYRLKHKDRINAERRARYAADEEFAQKDRDKARKRHADNRPELTADMKNRAMWRNYRRTYEDYDRVLLEQGGHCASCDALPHENMRLAWDHDHTCCPGKVTCGVCVRGLLCTKCNLLLGKLELGLLDGIFEYLERWIDAKEGTP